MAFLGRKNITRQPDQNRRGAVLAPANVPGPVMQTPQPQVIRDVRSAEPPRPSQRQARMANRPPEQLAAAEMWWQRVSQRSMNRDLVLDAFLAGIDYAHKAPR